MDEQNKHDGADIKPTAAAGDEANNTDIDDITSPPPLVEGPALLPLYKQKHVWIIVVAVVGAVVAMIIILPNTDDQKTASSQYQLQQMDALVALYDATNGDGWRYTNWLSDESICEWYGVECNSDGHVDKIDLYSNSLQGTIPTELGLLTSLQRLYVDGNSLQGTIPTELGLLMSLQRLYLHGNSLQGTIPTELGLLMSLQLLDVRGNSLQGMIPTELGLLMSLQWLYVRDNSLQGTIPTELGLLMSLWQLSVDGNSLMGAVPNEVCALRDINGGSLWNLYADCVEEVECTCCTFCCVDGGGCSLVE